MSNIPTQFDIEAEKIIEELEAQWLEDGGQTVNGRLTSKQEALSQLHNLYVQARVDELKHTNAKASHYRHLGVPMTVADRIATLEAQLTLKGDKV